MAKANQSNGTGRPSQEAIAKRAYELYLQRGSIAGYELDDWLQAEAELAAASAGVSSGVDQVGDARGSYQQETPPAAGDARRPNSRERSPGRRVLRQ